jgi:hypothetical protein
MRDSGIFNAPLSSMFDHKPIFLSFNNSSTENNQKNTGTKKRITNWFLDDNIVNMSVTLSTLQIYSKTIDENIHRETVEILNGSINLLCAKMLSVIELREKIALGSEAGENEEMLLSAYYSELKECVEGLPTWEVLSACQQKYTGKEIFVALTERLTEKVSGIQLKLTKI